MDKKLPTESMTLYPKSERKTITDRPWRLDCEIKNSHLYNNGVDTFYFRTRLMARYMAWYKNEFAHPKYTLITLIHQPSQGMLRI